MDYSYSRTLFGDYDVVVGADIDEETGTSWVRNTFFMSPAQGQKLQSTEASDNKTEEDSESAIYDGVLHIGFSIDASELKNDWITTVGAINRSQRRYQLRTVFGRKKMEWSG